jgi:uncharacterized protein YndB with AHSA1/START domain
MSNETAGAVPGVVLVELTVAAPAEAVWSALRDPAEINCWFGWDAPTLEEEIRFIFIEHAREVEGRLAIRFEGMSDSIEVEPRDGHCVVRLVRAGAAGDDTDWDGVYEDETEGWLAFLTQLRFAVERHAGQHRRTVFVAGVPADGAGASSARERLGLSDLQSQQPGSRYSVVTTTGDTLTGEVWRHSRRQLALTVDQWNDGLLLVMDRGVSERSPNGGGSAILTTFGMSDEEFEQLSERWTRWWGDAFPASPRACGGDA